MIVDKSALTMRNNAGEIVPVEIESEVFGGNIKLKPLTQGDFAEIEDVKGKTTNADIIKKFLIEPKLSDEEINILPLQSIIEIMTLVLMTSGMDKESAKKQLRSTMNNISNQKNQNPMK